jgi:hypothetical protein
VRDNDGALLELPSVKRRLAARKRDLRERAMVNLIKKECPDLADAKFNLAITGLARVALLTHDLQGRVYEESAFDPETGEPRRVIDTLLKGLNTLLKYTVALGLTPLAMQKLGLNAKPVTDLPAAFAELNQDGDGV